VSFVSKVGHSCIERGKLFHNLPPIIDNICWPKPVVRLNGILQYPFTEARVG